MLSASIDPGCRREVAAFAAGSHGGGTGVTGGKKSFVALTGHRDLVAAAAPHRTSVPLSGHGSGTGCSPRPSQPRPRLSWGASFGVSLAADGASGRREGSDGGSLQAADRPKRVPIAATPTTTRSKNGRQGGQRAMDHLRRTLSIGSRRRKDGQEDAGGGGTPAGGVAGGAGSGLSAGKPLAWQDDERKVRDGTCSFQVKYLGCIEVFESRGMEVCEEAAKILRSQNRSKYQSAVLYVSGDALRVVDEISKGLIVDQTIEKVSFCAPDRNHEKGFAYICRDGTTRRWLCHGFLARKESGERLSHAVGCAFAVCLERKQKREREAVEVTYSDDRTTFTRIGSFRQTTLIERMIDPQAAIVAEPVAAASLPAVDLSRWSPAIHPATARERPLTTPDTFARAGSFREFPKLAGSTSPFKRQLSLRLNSATQPSSPEMRRPCGVPAAATASISAGPKPLAAPAPSLLSRPAAVQPSTSPAVVFTDKESGNCADASTVDPISALCQQMTTELSTLTSGERREPAGTYDVLQKRYATSVEVPVARGFAGTGAAYPSYQEGLPARATHLQTVTPLPVSSTYAGASEWSRSSSRQNGTMTSTGIATSRPRPTITYHPGAAASYVAFGASAASPNTTSIERRTMAGGSTAAAAAAAAGAALNFSYSSLPAQAAAASAAAAAESDPFDAAWAVRAAGSTSTNPFLARLSSPLPPPTTSAMARPEQLHQLAGALSSVRGYEPQPPLASQVPVLRL